MLTRSATLRENMRSGRKTGQRPSDTARDLHNPESEIREIEGTEELGDPRKNLRAPYRRKGGRFGDRIVVVADGVVAPS
jgi:hypothetical protein